MPVDKGIEGIGLSDADAYAVPLADKFDYANTFFHAEPRLDIAEADIERYGGCDFIVASDVFEHVAPPVSRAFENAHRLLKSGGKLIFTVPFTLEDATVEHFPDLFDWSIVEEQGAGGSPTARRTATRPATTSSSSTAAPERRSRCASFPATA